MRFFRILTMILILVCAGWSLDLVIHKGLHNRSFFLIFLFAVWVLSPFIALLAANVVSRRWQSGIRRILYWGILLICVGSLVEFSYGFRPPDLKPAAVFLLVPFISWILIVIILLSANRINKSSSAK